MVGVGWTQGRWHQAAQEGFLTGKTVTVFQPLPRATHLSLPTVLRCPLSYFLSAWDQGVCLWVKKSVHGPFKKKPGFSATFRPSWMVGIPIIFHNQMLWGLLFPASLLWAGEVGVGLGSIALWPRYPSYHHRDLGLARFMSPPLWPVLIWLLLYILTYKTSVQPNFRCYSRWLFINLAVSVFMEGSRHSAYLLYYLGSLLCFLSLFSYFKWVVYRETIKYVKRKKGVGQPVGSGG